MLFSMLLAVSTASASEFSPTYDFALETGYLAHNDANWSYFGYPENTFGLRFAYHLSPTISIVSSYQSILANDSINDDYYYYEYEVEEEPDEVHTSSSLEAVQMSIRANQFTVGPKFSLNLKRWLVPYATAQGLLVHSHVRMGDKLDMDEATTFLKDSAYAVGAVSALGVELRSRPVKGKFQLNTYVEWGYGLSSNINFKSGDDNLPIGDLQYRGGYVRYGIGTRF